MIWPKKIHTRNLLRKKIPAARKIPLPPITFLMVRPLSLLGGYQHCEHPLPDFADRRDKTEKKHIIRRILGNHTNFLNHIVPAD